MQAYSHDRIDTGASSGLICRRMVSQIASQPLENDRWEAFAVGIAIERLNATKAYLAAYPDTEYEAAMVSACRLIRKTNVSDRIHQLRSESRLPSFLSLSEKREFLASAVRTPVGEIDEQSVLAQKITRRKINSGDGPEIIEEKIEMVSKLAALELDAKLAGELSGPVVNVSIRLESVAAAAKEADPLLDARPAKVRLIESE